MNLIDVIVIGAGPAGATVAKQIADKGFSVSILEKSSFPGFMKTCGGAISKEFCKELKLPNEIIEKETNRLLIHFPEEREFSIKSEFALFNRERFDTFLAEEAAESGAKILNSTAVTDVIRNGSEMIVYFKRIPSHQTKRMETRLVIFADGTETLANRKFRIGFQSKPDNTMLAATCDIKLHNDRDSLDFFVSDEISPFGYGWIFPKKDSLNVGVAVLLAKMTRNIRLNLDHLLKLENLSSLEDIKYGFRLIPQSIVEKMYDDSIMVVGDAAGTADPITGKGISNAIVNAKIAAEVAAKALEDRRITADLLAEYEKNWRETLEYQGIKSKYALQQLALKIGINPAISLKMGAFGSYEPFK